MRGLVPVAVGLAALYALAVFSETSDQSRAPRKLFKWGGGECGAMSQMLQWGNRDSVRLRGAVRTRSELPDVSEIERTLGTRAPVLAVAVEDECAAYRWEGERERFVWDRDETIALHIAIRTLE